MTEGVALARTVLPEHLKGGCDTDAMMPFFRFLSLTKVCGRPESATNSSSLHADDCDLLQCSLEQTTEEGHLYYKVLRKKNVLTHPWHSGMNKTCSARSQYYFGVCGASLACQARSTSHACQAQSACAGLHHPSMMASAFVASIHA